ncbi:MAG: ATP-binding cassette domain-containing protein [Candidatus Phytoplasma asteris]|uniref:Methionine transport ATP-binding protein n=1 Tax='Chrysanthemum coronarium' phytoplasma TaxID=1520703 RepID=A0ABQ0J2K9_9MOLU|nr:ATP-binding cassette domain-containing protein ['Chrysanthemum coronarium' phytoplasma]TKA87663.1 MAG: D-methionine transport system ATP-binding protein [Periwinkle leaf yellowing phytoplasma]WEX20024.1 MAG: ATP-binding cassette domain-containing protein [Candidatus Phytoplasma asteris]GAK73829.1 methionine transport ATP-binding protein ['Chrysanthemum coronarium' phytoplasma]
MIKINNLSKTFFLKKEKLPVLQNISLAVLKGEIFGLVGTSGSGKTTLLKIMNGFMLPDKNANSSMQKAFIHLESAMIFQNFNLLSNLNVFENVALPLEIRSTPEEQITTKVNKMLDFVGLRQFATAYPKTLSGGQKQRVAIARALVYEPKIIFCDEPTFALDEMTSQEILKLLQTTNQKLKTTIVLVSHNVAVIKSLCHRVAILEQGKLAKIATLNPSCKFEATSYQNIFI